MRTLGREAKVADPAVRAAADEDDVDLLAEDRLAGLQVHVLERALEGAPLAGIGLVRRRGNAAGDRDAHAGVRAVGDHRLEGVGVDRDRAVVRRAVVGRQRPPARDGRVPGRARGRVRASVQVLERRVVGRDQAGPRAAFDAHVADRHPLLHRQAADGVAGVFEDVAGPAADPDPGDQREDDVLGADAGRQPAVDPDLVGLRVALEQRLRGEDHLDLARADAERERAERAVRAGVRIAADDRHARLGQAELRPDDMDDALRGVADAVQRDAELGAVRLELADLGRGHLVEDRQAAVRRRDRVVGRRDGPLRVADLQAAGAEPGERLWARDLVDEMEVDGEDGRGARVLGDDVLGPDLVDDRARVGHAAARSVRSGMRQGVRGPPGRPERTDPPAVRCPE